MYFLAEWHGKYCPRYHLNLVLKHVQLKEIVTSAYGNSLIIAEKGVGDKPEDSSSKTGSGAVGSRTKDRDQSQTSSILYYY